MALETFGNNISTLVATNPTGADPKSIADDHIRGVKSVLLAQFPALTAPVTATHTLLNKLGITQTFGTNNTDPASTAFVQAAIANVNAVSSLVRLNVDAATQTAAVGNLYEAHYAGVVAFTMPTTTTDGALVGFVTANNYDNTVDFGSQILLGAFGELTGVVSLSFGNLACRWNQTKSKWVVTT